MNSRLYENCSEMTEMIAFLRQGMLKENEQDVTRSHFLYCDLCGEKLCNSIWRDLPVLSSHRISISSYNESFSVSPLMAFGPNCDSESLPSPKRRDLEQREEQERIYTFVVEFTTFVFYPEGPKKISEISEQIVRGLLHARIPLNDKNKVRSFVRSRLQERHHR